MTKSPQSIFHGYGLLAFNNIANKLDNNFSWAQQAPAASQAPDRHESLAALLAGRGQQYSDVNFLNPPLKLFSRYDVSKPPGSPAVAAEEPKQAVEVRAAEHQSGAEHSSPVKGNVETPRPSPRQQAFSAPPKSQQNGIRVTASVMSTPNYKPGPQHREDREPLERRDASGVTAEGGKVRKPEREPDGLTRENIEHANSYF